MLKNSLTRAGLIAIAAAFAIAASSFVSAQQPGVKRTILLRHDVTAPGYEAVLVQGEIAAGAREGRHTHPGTAVIHVLEGALTLDYEGQPSKTYKAGESFFVEGGKVHEGINKGNVAIRTLATFVIPKGPPLTTQVK